MTKVALATETPIDQLRSALLETTLRHAWEGSPFYRRHWGAPPDEVRTPGDLARLPAITKEHLERDLDDMVVQHHMPDFIQFTGGTLGIPSLRYRDSPEMQALEERNQILERMMGVTRRSLALRLLVPMNAPELFIPGRPSIVIPLVLEKHFLQADRLLRREFSFEDRDSRISVVVSGLDRLRMLTTYLLEKGYDFSQYEVRTVISSATCLTSRWRRVLGEAWGARVVDVYGLSEVSDGVAFECRHCGDYHVEPIAVPEVVSIETGEPIEEGVGILVLTALHPFVQYQPVIRYWTGDLVEIRPPCGRVRDLTLRFRGRLVQSTLQEYEGATHCLLFSTDLVDVLDDVPDFAIEPETLVLGLDSRDVGYHRWQAESRVAGGRIELTLRVVLRYEPKLYPSRLPRLRDHVLEGLRERNPTFRSLLDDGRLRVDLRFEGPGSSLEKRIV